MQTGERIYMDYQASTPLDPRVMAAMMPYFFEHPGNPHASEHVYGWEAHAAVESASRRIAEAIGADPDEIVFTSGATESNNLALLGAVGRRSPSRRRILVSSIEHKCVLSAARAVSARSGMTVEFLSVDDKGIVRLADLERRLSEDVLLVAVMAVNNEIGTIEPIAAIADMCRKVGAFLHVDGVQALATGSLDVHTINAEFLSLSAHKIYGPKGIGALYVRRDVRNSLEPLLYGGEQQGGLRPGTLPVQSCVAFGEAVSLMTDEGADAERGRIIRLRDRLIEGLRDIRHGIELVGPSGRDRHPGNVNMRFPDVDAHHLLMAVQPRLAAATGSACTSGIPEPSHVLRAVGLTAIEAMSCVRFGVGRFSTDSEVERAISIVREAIRAA